MNISPDMYINITKFLDDRTTLNMLSVNKKFNDPKFFERILDLKYPGLKNHKPFWQSWKEFYLEMTYYINKLKEKYDIPYIHDVERDPKELYEEWGNEGNDKYIYDIFMEIAAYVGDLEYVKLMVSKGATNFGDSLFKAAVENNLEIIKYILQQKELKNKDLVQAIVSAISRDNNDIAYYIMDNTNVKLKSTYPLEIAAIKGNLEMVEYILNKDSNIDYNRVLDILSNYKLNPITKNKILTLFKSYQSK